MPKSPKLGPSNPHAFISLFKVQRRPKARRTSSHVQWPLLHVTNNRRAEIHANINEEKPELASSINQFCSGISEAFARIINYQPQRT